MSYAPLITALESSKMQLAGGLLPKMLRWIRRREVKSRFPSQWQRKAARKLPPLSGWLFSAKRLYARRSPFAELSLLGRLAKGMQSRELAERLHHMRLSSVLYPEIVCSPFCLSLPPCSSPVQSAKPCRNEAEPRR